MVMFGMINPNTSEFPINFYVYIGNSILTNRKNLFILQQISSTFLPEYLCKDLSALPEYKKRNLPGFGRPG